MKTRKLLLLSVALVSYLAIGAEIFFHLEKSTSKEPDRLKQASMDLAKKYNISKEDILALKKAIKHEAEDHFGDTKWTYWSSLYFCGSVVTTIGYGHLAPRTPLGRIICIIYASFGIPLNLWLIKVVGEKIHVIISSLIQLFEEKLLGREAKNLKIKGFVVAALINLITLILGGLMYKYSEKWSLVDGIYFCFIVYSTIGFGDLVPNEGHAPVNSHEIGMMLLRAFNLMLGLCLLSSLLASAMNAADDIRVAFPPFNTRVYPFKSTKHPSDEKTVPQSITKKPPEPIIQDLEEEDRNT